VLDGDAAEPGAEEAADLVDEHRRTEQARQPLDAERTREQLGGRRQRRHVREPDRDREREQRSAALRRRDEGGDRDHAQAVDDDEQRRAREALHDEADADAARHVRGAGDDEPGSGERCRHAAALDHARHVDRKEGDMEAAHREAPRDQPEAPIADRFASLLEAAGHGDGARTLRKRARERQCEERDRAERAERGDPALRRDRDRDERREHELARRSAGTDDAACEAAFIGGGAPAHLADQERVARDRSAGGRDDEHQEDEREKRVDDDEERGRGGEQARAAGDHAPRAEAARERLDGRQRSAGGELAERRGEPDRRHAEPSRRVERRQEHPERRSAARDQPRQRGRSGGEPPRRSPHAVALRKRSSRILSRVHGTRPRASAAYERYSSREMPRSRSVLSSRRANSAASRAARRCSA